MPEHAVMLTVCPISGLYIANWHIIIIIIIIIMHTGQ